MKIKKKKKHKQNKNDVLLWIILYVMRTEMMYLNCKVFIDHIYMIIYALIKHDNVCFNLSLIYDDLFNLYLFMWQPVTTLKKWHFTTM